METMKSYQIRLIGILLLAGSLMGQKAFAEEDSIKAIPYSMTVVITELNATGGSQGNQVNWTTILEANLSHYIVEKSSNNQPFAGIATIKGKGSSSVAVNYEFIDTKPSGNKNVYRLKMVDTRGGFRYSEHRVVNGNDLNLNGIAFHAYPNPARSGNVILMDVPHSGNYSVRLVSLQGVVVKTEKLSNTHGSGLRIQLPSNLEGIYILEVVHIDGGDRYQQKILIQ
jgi:hypothetical protein